MWIPKATQRLTGNCIWIPKQLLNHATPIPSKSQPTQRPQQQSKPTPPPVKQSPRQSWKWMHKLNKTPHSARQKPQSQPTTLKWRPKPCNYVPTPPFSIKERAVHLQQLLHGTSSLTIQQRNLISKSPYAFLLKTHLLHRI